MLPLGIAVILAPLATLDVVAPLSAGRRAGSSSRSWMKNKYLARESSERLRGSNLGAISGSKGVLGALGRAEAFKIQ
jgi:hypothetical protein